MSFLVGFINAYLSGPPGGVLEVRALINLPQSIRAAVILCDLARQEIVMVEQFRVGVAMCKSVVGISDGIERLLVAYFWEFY